MYDQYGFYSDNIRRMAAGPGRRWPAGRPAWVSAGSIFRNDMHSSARRAVAGGAATGGRIRGDFQRIFSQFFGGGTARPAAPQPEKGSDLEYGLNIDFWQAIRGTQVRLNISRARRPARPATAPARLGGSVDGLPGVQRHRQRDANGGRHEVQPHLPALRRNGAAAKCVPDLPRRRALSLARDGGSADSAGRSSGSRLRVAGKGNAGTHGGAGGRSLHHGARGDASVFPPRRRQHRDPGAGDVSAKPGWAPRSKCRPSTAGRC